MLTLLRPPGVYRPQGDTWLLADALRHASIPTGARALDMCCGTGALAVTAMQAGARQVIAVDICHRAAMAAWVNSRLRGRRVQVAVGDALDVGLRAGPFDVVTVNPPYVPAEDERVPARGPARAWDAGTNGRAVLDRICAAAPFLLARKGILMIVQSVLSDVNTTERQLRDGGLKTSVVARREVPFGPVLRSRRNWLVQNGLVEPHQETEELVVIRADRTA